MIDEWNRDKMLETPPVYNLVVFPRRSDTANQENKETQALSPVQSWNVLLIVRSNPFVYCFFVHRKKMVVRSVNIKN